MPELRPSSTDPQAVPAEISLIEDARGLCASANHDVVLTLCLAVEHDGEGIRLAELTSCNDNLRSTTQVEANGKGIFVNLKPCVCRPGESKKAVSQSVN